MTSKLAIKQLTPSDLTLFKWHFRNKNAGNQKAINLNADVFVDELYPNLPQDALSLDGRLPIDLYLYGPRLGREVNLQRKIVKLGSYKNWRLDGEFIDNPEQEPQRFNCLESGDLALMEFIGDPTPSTLRLFFVSRMPEDDALWQRISPILRGRSMVATTDAELLDAIEKSAPPAGHPIHEFLLEATLEDAAQGGPKALRKLGTISSTRRVSRIDLQRALRNCDAIGLLGEEVVHGYLSGLKLNGAIRDFTWASEENAVSPFDFSVVENDGSTVFLEVKSTSGEFGRAFHVSLPEVETMTMSSERYDIYRVFDVRRTRPGLRVARDTRSFARKLLDGVRGLPEDVEADGFSVMPHCLSFGKARRIVVPKLRGD